MPDDAALRSYYNEAYMVPPERYVRQTAKHAPPILRELEKKFLKKGRLLEVGCSWGFFLNAARRDGWQTTGIELDARAATHAREKLGLKVLTGTLENERMPLEPPYDAIVSFHVIEHLRDPIAFLRRCRELLSEDGVLILKTPNVASWIAKRTGAYWEWLCPPAHIHLFSPGTLELALHKSGFHAEKIWSRRGDAHNNLYQLFRALVANLGSRSYVPSTTVAGNNGYQPRVKGWQLNTAIRVSDAIYYPFGLVLDPWLERKGMQAELVAVATKSALPS
jgi:2-polyprenyl-3-methyl-5-hydroxy-6-metoxy-1,4-benzoquinol methylase